MSDKRVILEDGLATFRREQISPEALLGMVEKNVRALVRLPVGVGKSHAVDELLNYPDLYERFAIVIYAAPSWNILNERRVFPGAADAMVPAMQLVPRPRKMCDKYAERWEHYESLGCSSFAKATLCRECQELKQTALHCPWPDQFARIKDHQLLLMTEQQLVLNRGLIPLLRSQFREGRILVILDEARLLDTNFEVSVEFEDLVRFRAVLDELEGSEAVERWLKTLGSLSSGSRLHERLDLPPWLNRDAAKIQKAGIARFGDSFRYIGYDLALLAISDRAERWVAGAQLRFVGRPYLGCHALILSAHLSADYVGERLGGGPLASPFESLSFQHSESRILNLRNRIGADRYFPKNSPQILDTVAVMLVRNIMRGVATVLVSRKKSKRMVAGGLEKRLAGWGVKARFVWEDGAALPEDPDPRVIPVIHYGILGVNDFTRYCAAYCVNGYYISSKALSDAVQESTPHRERATLKITSQPDRVRRATVEEGADPGGVLANTANIYLRKLELDPVVQAVGRVRFATLPREVVFFQMADLEPLIGPHAVVESLEELRRELQTPSAGDVDRYLQAQRIESALLTGATTAEVAADIGVSLRTARRRRRLFASAKSPIYKFIEGEMALRDGRACAGSWA
jgi:hypothetical protein